MLWQDRAFVAVAGAGTLLSVAHYMAKVRSVSGQVPIHFDISGVPDRFAAPWAFVLYPLMAVALGVTVAATTLPPSSEMTLPPNSVEQVATRASLLCGYVVVIAAQLCSTQIAEGSASRLPSPVMWILYGVLGASVGSVLVSKGVRK